MEIEIHSVAHVTVVSLTGQLDTNTSREVQSQLLPRVEPEGQMVLDLSGVDYMSSAGLRVLLSLYRHTSNQRGSLVMVGVAEEIRDTMEVTGFWDFFQVCDTLDQALARLGATPAGS